MQRARASASSAVVDDYVAYLGGAVWTMDWLARAKTADAREGEGGGWLAAAAVAVMQPIDTSRAYVYLKPHLHRDTIKAFRFIVLREGLANKLFTAYGLVLSIIGMCVFNVGLTYGLGAIGAQTGAVLPAAFMEISISEISPIYSAALGLVLVILFAWFMGFGATLAEPALNALGLTVQNLTNGAFRKSMLMYSVATGVAFGIALGMAKILFEIDLAMLLIPLYLIALVLTYFSTEEFVNVAWDSAGVTTGPVTVPLVLAMGLGLGNAVSAIEGFGILSMASIGPIIAVLGMGQYIRFKQSRMIAAEGN